MESTGQAKAEAQSRAEAAKIEGEAAVEQAKLKAEASKIEAVSSNLNSFQNNLLIHYIVLLSSALFRIVYCVILINAYLLM